MTFQCKDLDLALQAAELPGETKAHAETCTACANRLRLWQEISDLAPQLKEEWESPELWQKIETSMKPGRPRQTYGLAWPRKESAAIAAAAIFIAVAIVLFRPSPDPSPSSRIPTQGQFLTADTLRDVERTRAAYVQAIDQLAAVAGPGLEQSSTPLASVYREKLLLLDSAIRDLRKGVEANPYNVYLQSQLASLYEEKENTLKEWLENAKSN